MVLVAVTGGIGSGKSTVSAGLAERGAALVDADLIAREVVAPGGAAYDALRSRFPEVWDEAGCLVRPALAATAFADPVALADLNAITHPAIGATVLERLAALAGEGPVVLDVPLLMPATIEVYRPAAVVVVEVPEEVAVSRLVQQRHFAEDDARARLRAQVRPEERRRLLELVPAGRVVDNSGDRAALEVAIDETWAWILGLPVR